MYNTCLFALRSNIHNSMNATDDIQLLKKKQQKKLERAKTGSGISMGFVYKLVYVKQHFLGSASYCSQDKQISVGKEKAQTQ